MVVPKIVVPKGKQRLLALVFLAVMALIIGCSSADAPERATRIPRSPAPPTVDVGATVDAKVKERLAEATITASRPTVTAVPTMEPTATPEQPTPVSEETATPEPTPTAAPTATPVPTSTPTIVDDHGDDLISATAIDLTLVNSPVVIRGDIETPADADHFSFVLFGAGEILVFDSTFLPISPVLIGVGRPVMVLYTESPETPLVTANLEGDFSYTPPSAGVAYIAISSRNPDYTGPYQIIVHRAK
jgi:hypothetical protein